MFERVAVVGAGAAGLSACWAAAPRGAELRLFDGSVGASCLAGGAVDDRPWEQVARASEVLAQAAIAGPLPHSLLAFSNELGLWRLPDEGAPLPRLATEAGRTRLARGYDRALLDLSSLAPGSRIVLPRVPRAEWDADSLARSLTADGYAVSRSLRFEAVDAKVLKHVGEDRIAAAELASRHDDDARRQWLSRRLGDFLSSETRVDAMLLGPWLGADRPRAEALSETLGVPVGEILSGVGSAAGMRFESARLDMLSRVGVEIEPRSVTALRRKSGEYELRFEQGDPVQTDAVVLAIGGVAAGGVVFEAPEHRAGQDMARAGGVPFRLSLDAKVDLQAYGRRIDVVGSMFGPPLDDVAWPVDADPAYLESVGVACDGVVVRDALFAAGDVMADRPRTLLQAVFSGILAGAAAGGEPGERRSERASGGAPGDTATSSR
jgi:glycerol-3-phosphate dehydrogenase subunit B